MAWVDIANDESGASVRAKLNALGQGIGSGIFPSGSAATPAFRFSGDEDTGLYRLGANIIGISTGGVARLVVDPSGNVGIGTTSPSSGLDTTSFVWCGPKTASPGVSGQLRLRDDTGAFRYVAGILGLVGETAFSIFDAVASAERMRIDTSGHVLAGSDNAQTLGGASKRWSVVYAGTGTINTSDERDKHWRGELNAAELRAAKRIIGELGIYQWNDAIAEKGEDKARLHTGVRAQRCFQIMEDEGLDWRRYAWACYDKWEQQTEPVMEEVTVTKTRKVMRPSTLIDPATGQPALVETEESYEETEMRPTRVILEAGDRYGIRPDQLLFWLIAAQEQRIAALEA